MRNEKLFILSVKRGLLLLKILNFENLTEYIQVMVKRYDTNI